MRKSFRWSIPPTILKKTSKTQITTGTNAIERSALDLNTAAATTTTTTATTRTTLEKLSPKDTTMTTTRATAASSSNKVNNKSNNDKKRNCSSFIYDELHRTLPYHKFFQYSTLKRIQRVKFHGILQMLFFIFICLAHCIGAEILNQAPHFVPNTGDMSRFSLSENTPVGSPIYQLRGIDPEGSRLKYSISGPVFSVDRETGVVRLRQELDRETQDTVEVIISITDEGVYGTEPNTVSLRREVPVRDYNDNYPTFIDRPYSANVSESLKVGFELEIVPPIKATDKDIGENGRLKISCYEENDICDTFNVEAIELSEGNYTARVTLKKPLDFESRPSYIMTVVATDDASDNPLSSFASVSINVIDVQDQLPIFTNAPYSATVSENTPPGTSILTVKAIDGDIGIPRNIFLSLEDEVFGHFVLEPHGSPKDGMAILKTTAVPLDRENPEILQNGGVYVFNVRATELIDDKISSTDSTTTSVTIVVTDVDDYEPEFNANHFNISIPENLADGMPLPGLSIFVDDRDMGENSRYELRLRDFKNSKNVFAVSPTSAQGRTPVVVRVLNSSRLDFDVEDPSQRRFDFELLTVVRGEEASKTHVEVHLLDVNDNSPKFERNHYRFSVLENATIDSRIAVIKASDKDSGKFGKIKFLLKGFGADNFHIDPNTGGFYVRKHLDYERQNSYSLAIVAIDGGGRETNVNLYVDIVDVNDNAPIFESNEYTRTIREGTSVFEPQLFIRALDMDGPLQGGGRVKYAIVSENSISGNVFRIDEETGEIVLQKVARSMDTVRGEYELIVSATDYGEPPLTNTTKVFVRVGISGNQRPIFKGHFQNIENVPVLGPPSYRVSIPENAEPGYNVTRVSAHDPDGFDSLLRYRIVGANDNFEIDEITGLITVSPQAHIDRDSNMDSFEITVNAVDSGLPIPETATTTVYVNIKDINDESPKFEHASYASYVSERTDIGESILRVRAIDKDLNSKLQYSIKEILKSTSKAGVSIGNKTNYNVNEAFRIDSETGEIFVNNSLRHDVAAVIIFTVEVQDLNAEVDPEEQYDTTEVTIYVQSFKDTNPIFKNHGWKSSKPIVNVRIKEEMPIDSALFILQAEDPVSKSPIYSFELVEPRILEFFQVHERSGEVLLKKRLDYEALVASKTQFEFQVKASSDDGERVTITRVNVTIENVNDNSPMFEESSYRATIIENKKYPEKVIKVKAIDKDAVLTERDELMGYHRIVYSLHGENAGLFEINNSTGEIVVAQNQIIDRESTPHIHLQVKAEDSPNHPMEAKQSIVGLTIDVLDMNDNPPIFSQSKYTTVIQENAPVDSLVIRVHATDADDGPGGEVRYELVNEGDLNGYFKINPSTGELKTKRELTGKGRSEPYILLLRAQDNGSQVPKQVSISADVDLLIYIGDVSANDGIPYFIAPELGETANVTENTPAGTAVFRVLASDPDDPSTPSGTLFYSILKDTPDADSFTIDPNTGLITTLEKLDRETKDTYNVILEVYDNGQPRQAVTRILKITVIDVDDHEPRFAREVDAGPLEFSVLEEAAADTEVGTFKAIDEDIGDNGRINYVITEGNDDDLFAIQQTNDSIAVLRTKRPIDRESAAWFVLTVKCLKHGQAAYKFIGNEYDRNDLSQLRLAIKIIDIDDNLPMFEQKGSSIGIRINAPIDTFVTNIHASDRDAEAAPILLTIENVTFVPQFYKRTRAIETGSLQNLFTLNNRTGELRTSNSLADYVDGYFDIKIRANNSVKTKRHTFNNIKVFVIRDKSLLKFVFARPPGEIQMNLMDFQDKIRSKLLPLGLELHVLDTQVNSRPDMSLDFTSASSCFQMFSNGSAMSYHDMQKLMHADFMKQALLDIYAEYDVSEVESCSTRRTQVAALAMTSAGTWLVILAALIGLAALVAALTAGCLRRKYKLYTKRRLQASRTPTDPFGMAVPAVFYAEPIYGPL